MEVFPAISFPSVGILTIRQNNSWKPINRKMRVALTVLRLNRKKLVGGQSEQLSAFAVVIRASSTSERP